MRLRALEQEIVACRACPRLVAWREQVAREKRAAYAYEDYWGKPVPGFGDPRARLVVVGLAPAAHGANRTGRMFTGDRSGQVLYAALHRAGFANQPSSSHRGDGLRLRDCWVTAPVRCAPPGNRPTVEERERCAPFLAAELALLPARVIVALGSYAWDVALRHLGPVRPKPRFGHGAEAAVGKLTLLGSYHVSQQNTFTGRLTPAMLDDVLMRASQLLAGYTERESSEEANPMDVDLTEAEAYLRGLIYPANGNDVAAAAKANGAPEAFIRRFEQLGNEDFTGPQDVVAAARGAG